MAHLRLAAAAVVCLTASIAAYVPSACNVLGDPTLSCMMPWPSDHFFSRTWDATAPPRLAYITNETLPIDNAGLGINVTQGWSQLTGFSPAGQALAYIPGLSLDNSALPRLWSVGSSILPGARSILLNTLTRAPLLHWCELDHSSDVIEPPEGYPAATVMWSAGRLNDTTRYIVAYQNLMDSRGVPIAASGAFAALRDRRPTASPDVEASRPRYEAIFSALAAAGFARSNLTIAWDFTTAELADLTGRIIAMRDDAFARVGGGAGIVYGIDKVQDVGVSCNENNDNLRACWP